MLRIIFFTTAILFAQDCFAQANPPARLEITWEVRNRFRLFTDERDFRNHVDAYAQAHSVLQSERLLAGKSNNGRGWAETIVRNDRLCFDRVLNRLPNHCMRDGKREVYLSSETHRVGVRLAEREALADADCTWRFRNKKTADQLSEAKCKDEIIHHAWYGLVTKVSVSAKLADGSVRTGDIDLQVRDILIAGMGDSVGSGEGNPDVPVRPASNPFCYFRLPGHREYIRPSRADYNGHPGCTTPEPTEQDPDPLTTMRQQWSARAANWKSPACHRSLYGYQMRTALALAIEKPHIAVTYLPLGCTGAEITQGMTRSQRAREIHCRKEKSRQVCTDKYVPSQFSQLRNYLRSARHFRSGRELDLLLLTIGANDIGFSALAAHVMVTEGHERGVLKLVGMIVDPEEANKRLSRLPARFVTLRQNLKRVVRRSLDKVVFVPYGDPMRDQNGAVCTEGRHGFDIHPAFAIDRTALSDAARFVADRFFPRLKSLAGCEADGACRNPRTDRMAISADHQPLLARHGFCASSSGDPAFDVDCFRVGGDSFRLPTGDNENPLACGRDAGQFRPYASRARWFRTPNDSYFSAMTFPDGLPDAAKSPNIHAGIWGVTSAVYGGALHPTAEGHAAMADGVLPKARCILGLRPKEECDPLLTN